MASKKGFAAGLEGGKHNVGLRDNIGIDFEVAAMVEEWEKADMGSSRVRRIPDGAGGAGSSNWSEVMRSGCVFHTAWKPPCNHPRSPVKPSFLNFFSKP